MGLLNKITLFLLFIPVFGFCQTEINLDNNLTGIYSENKVGQQFGLNYVGSNSLDIKKISIDLGTNYSLRYNPKLSENEFIQRANLGLNRENFDVFSTYQYNYSFVRSILADNWIGLGGGLKRKFDWGKLSFSYAFIYENAKFVSLPVNEILRHSFRTKVKINKNALGFSTEYYYQPSINNFSDFIVYGTSKIIIFQNRPFSLILQDVINYRSTSEVKMIHNLTIGCSYKFSKKIDKIQ